MSIKASLPDPKMPGASSEPSSSVQATGAPLPSQSSPRSELVFLLVRFALGGVFIYMGLHKVLHPIEFLKLVRDYNLVTGPPWLNLIAALLPWFEVFCGLLLLAGMAVRGAALNLLVMLIPFSIIIFRRAFEISSNKGLPFTAVKFDCGCGAGEVIIWQKLLENIALILLAASLLTQKNGRFAARFCLFSKGA